MCGAADLLVGCVEELVPLGPPHGQTQTVQDVNRSQEEAEQTQLFPTLQPALQPAGEVSVLGAVIKLMGGRNLSCQVNQGQQRDGHCGQRPVHHLYGDLIEVTLLVLDVRVDDIPHKGVGKEEDRQSHGSQDGALPAREQPNGHILNVPG